MDNPTLFFIAFIIIIVYILLGNYLYLVKAVSYLNTKGDFNGPSFLPSAQAKHLKRYALELEKEGVKSWIVFVAKYNSRISLIVYASLLILVGIAVTG